MLRRSFIKSIVVTVTALAVLPVRSEEFTEVKKPRKLKVRWSFEAEKSLQALYGIKVDMI